MRFSSIEVEEVQIFLHGSVILVAVLQCYAELVAITLKVRGAAGISCSCGGLPNFHCSEILTAVDIDCSGSFLSQTNLDAKLLGNSLLPGESFSAE